jgi:DNA-binding NarL/FixJ family response regulator
VAAGGVALDPEVITAMLARRDDAVEQLSARRREVLALIAQGRSNAGIARVLGISEKSVVAHTSGIYDASAWRRTPTTTAASSRWSST